MRKPIRTDIAWSTPSTITVKGFDLCKDILGTLSLGDIAFLELTDRLPTTRESVVFNAIAVTLVEHGLTPSAIATRMTYAGAPEAMQAAVAAGLCGLGSVFVGSMETAARMLQEALPEPAKKAESVYGKSLPVNATGAIGAIASELKLPWKIVRGIGVMARAIGLVGHILEEMREPMAREIKARVEEEATAHFRAKA